jgi:hypothetical protein
MAPQSCPLNCDMAERLNLSRKVVPQVTAAQTGAVVLDTWATFLSPNTATTWSSGLGHAPLIASAASQHSSHLSSLLSFLQCWQRQRPNAACHLHFFAWV